MTFSFLPADIVSQILNFGAPAPIDLQIRGNDLAADYAYANKLLAQIRHVTGVADARIQQSAALPTIDVNIDRTRARYTGVTAADVTDSLVVNLASSSQVAPTYWLNEKNGVTYPIALQTPQYQIDTLPAAAESADQRHRRADHGARRHRRHPPQPQRRRGLAVRHRSDGGDLRDDPGARSRRGLERHPEDHRPERQGQAERLDRRPGWPDGDHEQRLLRIAVRSCWAQSCWSISLIVINFQSWSDPFVIITALPAALAGIIWMLFATHTTLSVPALTGAIMCMGVATANSVLVISFAREKLDEIGDATQAALEAGFVRLRPVLMTALAMVIGMLPMALGLGEGGEQNAPLGRAVIGGLIFATVSTLFFVPVVFSIIHRSYGPKPTPEANLGGTHVPA